MQYYSELSAVTVSCSTLCVFVFQGTCGRVLLQASSITVSCNNMFGFLVHYCGLA